jgi:hypothetical protein
MVVGVGLFELVARLQIGLCVKQRTILATRIDESLVDNPVIALGKEFFAGVYI